MPYISELYSKDNRPERVSICNSKLSKIIKVSSRVQYLHLEGNCIARIQGLPDGLKSLYLRGNAFERIENLPLGLTCLVQDSAKYVDNVNLSSINFTLHGYQAIRRIQKRIKRRVLLNKKIRMLQDACRRWVWAPLLEDGTVGIRPRLDCIALGIPLQEPSQETEYKSVGR